MARNYVLIFVPETIQEELQSDYVQKLFFPFERGYDFPPFVRPCECNGVGERIDFANKNTKHFHQFWRSYNTLPSKDHIDWKEYMSEWQEAMLSSQIHFPAPASNCRVCKGHGFFTTTHYPLNMYDYWVGLKQENVGFAAEIRTEWKTIGLPNGKQRTYFQIVSYLQKAFMFYHVITSDGLPYNRWDYSNEQAWHDIWVQLTQQWPNSSVVRCLVHE